MKKILFTLFAGTCLMYAFCHARCCASSKSKAAVGKAAPDFTLKDENGTWKHLGDYKGKTVLLYFYPKDNTPGCTKQACSLRDGYAELTKANIVVLGVSYDSPKAHKKFKEEHHLPFTLLSDEDKKVAKAYGAASKWLWFDAPIPNRISFVIDEKGVITHIMKDIDVRQHAKQILDEIGTKQPAQTHADAGADDAKKPL